MSQTKQHAIQSQLILQKLKQKYLKTKTISKINLRSRHLQLNHKNKITKFKNPFKSKFATQIHHIQTLLPPQIKHRLYSLSQFNIQFIEKLQIHSSLQQNLKFKNVQNASKIHQKQLQELQLRTQISQKCLASLNHLKKQNFKNIQKFQNNIQSQISQYQQLFSMKKIQQLNNTGIVIHARQKDIETIETIELRQIEELKDFYFQ